MAVEAAFSQDGGNGFCFCFIELVMTEVALWKDVLEGGKIDSMIGQRSAVAGKLFVAGIFRLMLPVGFWSGAPLVLSSVLGFYGGLMMILA